MAMVGFIFQPVSRLVGFSRQDFWKQGDEVIDVGS
jgi:hypothetical protein